MPDENRTALVLGAVKGIGKGIAMDLARQGIRVAATWFDWEESLPDLEKDMATIGIPHLIVQTNLLDASAIHTTVRSVAETFGGIDILINNIERGGWPVVHGPYTEFQWDLEMATTLRAKRWVFDAALPWLRQSENACVINLSSIAALIGRSGPADRFFNDGYAAANRGIGILTETWARMGAPGIRVNELMLGFIETRHGPDTRGWGLLSAEEKNALTRHTLCNRTGTIADVTRAVNFILNDAPFMTGATIRLDGGYVLGGASVGEMPKGESDVREEMKKPAKGMAID
ncbi:MAG: 3-oxoacyl-ACP reductase [Deltaproteobacteria bacterium]|nr:MAG: 3-oxoacyl-ACP reductase [Deltaproteobacteria bacterium]